jgi:hypothetical protein
MYWYLFILRVVLLNILNKKAQAIVYLVAFNILFLMYVISYTRIVSKKPGTAKVLFRVSHIYKSFTLYSV